MKVLQLCNKPPYPSIDGGCIAMKNISHGLLENNVDLKIITIATEKHPFQLEKFPKDFVKDTKIEGVFVDTKVNIVDAFSALITSDNYNVSRFFSADFDILLKKTLVETDYDYIHLESLFLTPYIGTIYRYSKAKIVLRSHNLEHLIWSRLANLEQNKAKKIYLLHLAKNLKKYEENILNDVSGIAAISFEDTNRYQNLNCKIPLQTIPFGIEFQNYNPTQVQDSQKLNLFHIGSMDWSPNIEAVDWFVNDIMPLLHDCSIRLHLAGKSLSKTAYPNQRKIRVHGMVDSAVDFINEFDVMIVPLLSGSGMRIKIIEGMAMGKVVITTSVGVEGIDVIDKENIFIANTPEEFDAIIRVLISNRDELKRVGTNAREFIKLNHNNSIISKKLIQFYESLN